ncbi:enoyl-CoA hydratase-related protein [uncultured Pelagimonas sp.]|uniref:enoyl-CoA hydratase-related protein n=1 Tax=uncultured Pelagimonas sp. TaxID=1618102 RepID=UPI00260D8968|nr:enoyl-CoA hydratase-related protein [uncultured Pelagimonas sp.]
MADYIGYDVVDGVAFLSVTHPPVNALSQPVRVDLWAALDRADQDSSVNEIVVMGTGATFPAGGELGEFDSPSELTSPHLRDLCRHMEEMSKPIVAALHGTVFGGGCELALAAHYRLALRGTRLSLPELKLGLVPGAGATQRLPRLVGAKTALSMLLDCAVLTVDRAPGQGMVDGVCEGDLRQAALQYCLKLRRDGHEPTRLSDRRDGFDDMAAYQDAIKERRKALKSADEAAERIIELVEAAPMLPFEIGLNMEEDAHDTSLASDAAKALRHSFLAEHRARRSAAAAKKEQPKIETIAVLGAGPLAMQITVSALNAGMGVHWGARDAARLDEGRSQIEEVFHKGVESGGLSVEGKDQRMARLKTGASAEMIDGTDMILHAARGQGDVPAPRHLVRAVAMAAKVDELGLRFAPPVFATKLVEIVQGPECKEHQIAAARALAERLGKVPVVVKSTGDSAAGRMSAALQRAADGLIDLGANPYVVDAALVEWGWTKPPFQSRDTLGLEALAEAERGDGAQNWSAILSEVGRNGWVSGAGFYDWGPDGAKPSDAVPRLINGSRPPKDMSDEVICALIMGALANEGTRMLGSGMVQNAADLDLVSVLALDFPKAHGGVMKTVSQIGLFKVFKTMERAGHPDVAFWTPTPIWQELIKNGRTFDNM